MKAKFITFVRGLMNGTPPRFQSYLKSLTLLLGLMLSMNAWGADEPQTLLSFSRSGTNDSYTTGYTFSNAAEAKTGYYQDGSGTLRYLQLKQNSALFATAPSTVVVKAKLGGGTTKDALSNNVYACFVDKDGNNISGSEVTLTTKITNTSGSDFSTSMSTSLATKAYGLKIYHEKETGYNVRYYSFSLTYTAASSCSNSITITKGSTSNGTFTLSQEGDVCIDDGNATVVVTPTPNSHYMVDKVTTSESGEVSGPDGDGKYTVSDISASTTIKVTFAEKDKVTVTFTDKIHNNNSNRQEYVGDAIQFPSITDTEKGSGCEGEHYHFVGWTKDSSKPNDLVTPSNEKAPSTNVEYFAVWAKEAE